MNTPEWFGTIGVMNSQHLHRQGVIGSLRRAIGELSAAAACLRLWRVLSQKARAGRARPRRDRPMLAKQQPVRSA